MNLLASKPVETGRALRTAFADGSITQGRSTDADYHHTGVASGMDVPRSVR